LEEVGRRPDREQNDIECDLPSGRQAQPEMNNVVAGNIK
jgi:hypothetical protein